MKAAVVGLGRAGLPLAAVMAEAGLEVIGVDVDADRVKAVNAGVNTVPEEPGLSELLATKKIKATTVIKDAGDCSVYVVVVPLLLDRENRPDFRLIKEAFKGVASVLKDGDLVVLETTVPPGTTEGLVKKMLDKSGKKYLLAHSPERIMTGHSISRLREFPKVVGGVDEESAKAAYEFYRRFAKTVVKVKDARTAELVKVAEGVYRDVNIALANELLKVCDDVGVDFWEMRDAANHKYCSIHEPGMVGGHCIPVYPWFLINNHKVPLIKLARKLNDEMVEYYADRALEIAGEGGKVGVVGLSYRSGVKEPTHTRAHALIKALKKRKLIVYGMDPMFGEGEVEKLFEVKLLTNPGEMDAIIITDKNTNMKTNPEKTIDVKNTLKRTA
jgi:UDP-N-acetyl-D-mannosaminuronic acid dehydrogenase